LLRGVQDELLRPTTVASIAAAVSTAVEQPQARLDDRPPVTLAVIPTWIRTQLQDCAGLLGDAPERAKAEFRRLNMRFTLSPIHDEGRPFLRAEGIGDLDALGGTSDLDLPARQRSLR